MIITAPAKIPMVELHSNDHHRPGKNKQVGFQLGIGQDFANIAGEELVMEG